MERIKPLFVVGPMGCGKTTYIQKLAKEQKRELLHFPCRKDRTLREQRSRIHEWAMRSEPSLLWLEGTDDLTPEAQSFLRRILETYSTNVFFCLEARTMESIQEPVLSRCNILRIRMPTRNDIYRYGVESLGLSDALVTRIIDAIPHYSLTYRQFLTVRDIYHNHPSLWEKMAMANTKYETSMDTLDAVKSGISPYTYIYDGLEKLAADDQDTIMKGLLQYSNPWALYALKRVCEMKS
jgi:hypothetical protein